MRGPIAILLLCWTVALDLLVAFPVSHAAEVIAAGETELPELPSREQLRERVEALQNDSSLQEELRLQILDNYQQIDVYLSQIAESEEDLETSDALLATGPALVEKAARERDTFQQQLDEVTLEKVMEGSENPATVIALEQAQLAEAESKLSEVNRDVSGLEVLPKAKNQELAELRAERLVIAEQLRKGVPEDTHPELAQAQLLRLRFQSASVEARIAAAEAELRSYELRFNYLYALQEQTAVGVELIRKRVDLLSQELNRIRTSEAAETRRMVDEVSALSAGAHPLLKWISESNKEIAADLAQVVEETESASAAQVQTVRNTADLKDGYNNTSRQLEGFGLTKPLGNILREQRKTLPNLRWLRKRQTRLQNEVSEAKLVQFRLQEESGRLSDIDRFIEYYVLARGIALTAEDRQRIQPDIEELVAGRAEVVEKLIPAYRRYHGVLVGYSQAMAAYVDVVDKYSKLLNQHLFWIANVSPLSLEALKDIGSSLMGLFYVVEWDAVETQLLTGLEQYWFLILMLAPVAVLVYLLRRKLRSRLHYTSARIGLVNQDKVSYTFEALLINFLSVLPLSAVLLIISQTLLADVETATFSEGLGMALGLAAWMILFFRNLMLLLEPGGIAEKHFLWSKTFCQGLAKNLRWLFPILLLTWLIIALTDRLPEEIHRNGVGRCSSMIADIALCVFLWRLFHPERGLLVGLRVSDQRRWKIRLRNLFFPLAVGTPIALIVLAAIGYYYSALELRSLLILSFWFVLTAILLNALMVRWLTVNKRRLAYQQAIARRAARLAARRNGEEEETGPESSKTDPELVREYDLSVIDEQTRNLISTFLLAFVAIGFFFVWQELLPALEFFDEVVLWESTSADGQKTEIVLGNLTVAILIVVIASIANRNLPGLMELLIFQRMEVSPASRFAISTVSRYLIMGFAIVMAFKQVGIAWDQIQWLAAGLTVGLGFGLQEIVANFVSGLIILFERPIRIGDWVTVGNNLDGKVSEIRIRATTVVDWDNKEIIIPNKFFISDQLINWSLSSPITRVIIPVGVAYGSDTELVHKTLMEVAENHPLVLEQPKAQAFFLGFGDSTLNFELRVFVNELSDRLKSVHELHMAVDRKFREHNIEIAFPQLDVHLNRVD